MQSGRQSWWRSGKRARIVGLAFVLVGILACGAGEEEGDERTWSEGGEGSGAKERSEEAVPVEVAALERGEIEAVLRFSANLEAERDVQVFAEAPRRVIELLVEEGDRVAKDALLLRLEDAEQRSALAKAESQLRQAEREHERQKNLFEQKLSSEQVFNDATTEVEQRQLAYDDARRALSYTEVRSPIAGTVTQRLVNLGDYVTLNQPLFQVVDFGSIVARIYVPEKELGRLRPGQPARVRSDALGGRVFAGEVDRISPIVDPGTGTLKVTVAIPRQGGLRPGMYVDVELVTAVHPDAVLLPKRALVYDNDQIFVYRLAEERRVERVQVTPVLENAEFVEPGAELAAGDQVVVAGQSGLKDNALVRLPGDPDPDDEAEAEAEADTEDVEEQPVENGAA